MSCCANPATSGQGVCPLCQGAYCPHCLQVVRGNSVCAPCFQKITEEVRQELAGPQHYPLALVGGLVGAIISGILWAVIGISTNMEIGYVALAVGWLAAMGVSLATGGKKGIVLQTISVLCSGFGLFLAKYLYLAHALREAVFKQTAATPSWVDPMLIKLFFQHFSELLNPYDILWCLLAFATAWSMLAQTDLNTTGGAG